MKCEQPGCGGTVVDGYCEVCGMAPAPPSGSQGPSTATATSFTSTRRASATATRTSGRSRLGAGLVEIPSVPFRDPAEAVMVDPTVPESRRFCSRCDEPIGRGRDGLPGRTAGFCRKCGAAFSFDPKLQAGDVVARQYEVVGCLAHGGMGWVYLAKDRNVSDRWVVLKGLLNTGDHDAMTAALAERRFLAEVEHPNIVKIFNFVEHESSGYIVMEYVGGTSLKQILAARREANGGQADPLPPSQAIAYVLEVLPALGYLHDLGLLFCDFKLDNVIHTQHSLKLIDLGGVYRIDEPSSAVFGTVGYQAPEIAASGPSLPSDLFTVARALAVMSFDFRGYQGTFKFTLPTPDSVPLFARFDSLYRFLLKGTAPNPDDRFQSADEMTEQLHGVLREVVAEQESRPVPAPSQLFTASLRGDTSKPDGRLLPRPQVARDDPAAAYLATIAAGAPDHELAALQAAPERTVEVELRLVAALAERGDWAGSESLLAAIEARDPWDWRVDWYRGVIELARERPAQARERFTSVYHAVPGELAPKLALGVACELATETADAGAWYDIVSRTDPAFTTATFGLARCRLATGDRAGALTAYERVPDSSSAYLDAQVARIRCLSGEDATGGPTVDDLLAAAAILDEFPGDSEQRVVLTAELLEVALQLARQGRLAGNGRASLLGHALAERDLRFGLERCYRALAGRTASGAERIRLVDRANGIRPRTWT